MLFLALAAAGSLLSSFTQSQADKESSKVAQLNAISARISTAFKVQDMQDAGKRLQGTQMTRAAASGVDVGSGSAVEVMNESARQIEKEIYRTKYTGGLEEEGATTTAEAYQAKSNYDLMAGFLGGTATYLGGMAKLRTMPGDAGVNG